MVKSTGHLCFPAEISYSCEKNSCTLSCSMVRPCKIMVAVPNFNEEMIKVIPKFWIYLLLGGLLLLISSQIVGFSFELTSLFEIFRSSLAD